MSIIRLIILFWCTVSVWAPVSLRPPPPEYRVCSDRSAHTCLNQLLTTAAVNQFLRAKLAAGH